MSKTNSIIHDRSTAIRLALGAFLDARQTAEALQLWQEKYAGEPTFSVQYFARECCTLFGVESKRSQLIKSLVRELYTQKLSAPDTQPLRNTLNGPQATAATQVFQLLLQTMINSTDAMIARDIIVFVEAGMAKMSLDKDTLRALQRWLNQSKSVIDTNLPLPVMITLVNRTYVGLCEYIGPIKADLILHDAVVKASKIKAAQLFHPEELL